MIKVQDLSKNYGDVQAVKSINFEIDDGEIVGFLGENGAGKTTTLKMLTGYLVPTKGNVEINDLNINDSALEIQKQIGYLPELNPLYPEMSVYEYLEFIARVRNITGKSFREALARVVERCGLQGVVHKLVSSCSKGYKQRIGLHPFHCFDSKYYHSSYNCFMHVYTITCNEGCARWYYLRFICWFVYCCYRASRIC